MWDWAWELREWEWLFQQLLAGGEHTAEGSLQTVRWRQSMRFQHSDLFSHSICSEACVGSHMGRDSYISVSGCSRSCETLYSKVSKARSESLRLNTLRKIWRTLTPYGPVMRIGKPPTYFILSIFSLEHSSAHSTVQSTQDWSCSGAEHQCRQDQGWAKSPALRPAAPRHSSGSETGETVEKPLFAVPDEMKCYCPLRLSQCSAVQTQLLLHPQQRFVPVSAQGLLSLLYLILHCHTVQRNCSSQTSVHHKEQTRATKKITAFPTLEQRQRLEGRDAPTCFLNRFFSHFPILHSKLSKYLQGQNPVLGSWSSDMDKWQSIQSPFFGRNCLQ